MVAGTPESSEVWRPFFLHDASDFTGEPGQAFLMAPLGMDCPDLEGKDWTPSDAIDADSECPTVVPPGAVPTSPSSQGWVSFPT